MLVKSRMRVSPVPREGPLSLGSVYQRAALHERFGGNKTAGIVPSLSEPAILLFHTKEGAQQFYGDGTDENGVYWYSGMGAEGDMEWNHANRAVRDHSLNGKDLLLFERVQRQGGFWQFAHLMHCVGWKEELRQDRDGLSRKAIIFGLVPVDAEEPVADDVAQVQDEALQLYSEVPTSEPITKERVVNVYARSVAVRQAVLSRAKGVCEACHQPAPFIASSGEPFLEAHHIDRLADNGPDRPERVAAVCPNCHRRCHYGADHLEYNQSLRLTVAAMYPLGSNVRTDGN
jgi:5-methylcytosine-specific restriction protein A